MWLVTVPSCATLAIAPAVSGAAGAALAVGVNQGGSHVSVAKYSAIGVVIGVVVDAVVVGALFYSFENTSRGWGD